MSAPITLDPPRPGDGSGIATPKQDNRMTPEWETDAYHDKMSKKHRQHQTKRAFEAFRTVFVEHDFDE